MRSERLSLLKEILDRIELPPESEIPGKAEVADGTLTRWTIPDTSITIKKIEHGPRAGEFLFSADTVQRLKRLYRSAKHLPYKPGATVGWYEGFLDSLNRAHALITEADAALKATPPTMTKEKAREVEITAGILLSAWVLMEGVHELGVDVVPLLAGLGIGGLALALAARPTIENIIGRFMIFADKPYKIGQRVKVMGQNGTVESIGLRSTKIRLLGLV